MTNNNSPTTKLVLALEHGRAAKGPAPSAEELALLHTQQLNFSRRQEVLSHLNTNPELWRQWLASREADLADNTNPASETKANLWHRLGAWLWQPGPAAAISACLVLVLLWPSLPIHAPSDTGTEPQMHQPSPFAEIERAEITDSLHAGIVSAFTQLAVSERKALALALGVDDKNHASIDAIANTDAFALGAQAVEIYQQCATDKLTPQTASAFLSHANALIENTNAADACALSTQWLQQALR